MIRIPLRDRDGQPRAYALVDDRDEEMAQHRWSFNAGYASRCVQVPGAGQRTVLLHRVLLGLKHGDGVQTDHVNGDRLDCRRANLRIVTHQQNAQNVPGRLRTSRYRGVCWAAGKWRATATIAGQQYHLGRFDDELEAAEAARKFRAERMPFANEARAAA